MTATDDTNVDAQVAADGLDDSRQHVCDAPNLPMGSVV